MVVYTLKENEMAFSSPYEKATIYSIVQKDPIVRDYVNSSPNLPFDELIKLYNESQSLNSKKLMICLTKSIIRQGLMVAKNKIAWISFINPENIRTEVTSEELAILMKNKGSASGIGPQNITTAVCWSMIQDLFMNNIVSVLDGLNTNNPTDTNNNTKQNEEFDTEKFFGKPSSPISEFPTTTTKISENSKTTDKTSTLKSIQIMPNDQQKVDNCTLNNNTFNKNINNRPVSTEIVYTDLESKIMDRNENIVSNLSDDDDDESSNGNWNNVNTIVQDFHNKRKFENEISNNGNANDGNDNEKKIKLAHINNVSDEIIEDNYQLSQSELTDCSLSEFSDTESEKDLYELINEPMNSTHESRQIEKPLVDDNKKNESLNIEKYEIFNLENHITSPSHMPGFSMPLLNFSDQDDAVDSFGEITEIYRMHGIENTKKIDM